jgi:hypothetical protein
MLELISKLGGFVIDLVVADRVKREEYRRKFNEALRIDDQRALDPARVAEEYRRMRKYWHERQAKNGREPDADAIATEGNSSNSTKASGAANGVENRSAPFV